MTIHNWNKFFERISHLHPNTEMVIVLRYPIEAIEGYLEQHLSYSGMLAVWLLKRVIPPGAVLHIWMDDPHLHAGLNVGRTTEIRLSNIRIALVIAGDDERLPEPPAPTPTVRVEPGLPQLPAPGFRSRWQPVGQIGTGDSSGSVKR